VVLALAEVMRTLAHGSYTPTDEEMRHEISHEVRGDAWTKIKQRAETRRNDHVDRASALVRADLCR
jgi:hypothetical protein